MKKLNIVFCTLLMVSILSGCATSDSNAATNTDTDSATTSESSGSEDSVVEGVKSLKYGFISWGTADEHGRTLNQAVKWAVDAVGGEFVMDGSALSAETTIAAAENLIQSGCNIISFCTYGGEASVAQISRLAQENQVYWTMWDTTISDPDILSLIDADPYFVGTTNEDQYQAGYDTMKYMIEQGARKVIVVKYGVNVPTCDDRVSGAEAAAEEFGAEILYTIVAPDDPKKAAQDALIAYPETDSCFVAGGAQNYAPPFAQAFKEAGHKKFYIGTFDFFDQMGDMLKDGDLAVINGGHMVTGTFSALMGINAYFGTPLSDEKYSVTIPYLTLKSYDDYLAYKEYASEGAAYTSSELQQFVKVYNPALTLESFQENVSKWGIADIVARKSE